MNISKKTKVACLGLSANPPHLGHMEAANLVLKKKLADEVWLIPCFKHPFDKELVSAPHRWRMLKLCLPTRPSGHDKIKVSGAETGRGRKFCTIDTVRALRTKYPNLEFSWIIGSDIVKKREYKCWQEWNKLKRLTKFLVVERPGYGVKKLKPPFVSAGSTDIRLSSTEIRERIGRGLSIRRLVPRGAKEYIEKHNLYRQD